MTRLALILALLAAPAAAQAPMACVPLAALNALLGKDHGERPTAEGVIKGGSGRLVVWANPETGTWTAAVVGTTGAACLFAAGEGWDVAKPKAEERGA